MTVMPEIHQGDCLEVLERLGLSGVDLVYMDPPFNTRRMQAGTNGSFRDAWTSVQDYLAFLRPRLARSLETLHESGSMLVHCDWRTSHHVRMMLEELLGPDAFVNHLIWRYGLGGSSPRRFARKHDDILFFARTSSYYFDPPRVPASSRRMEGEMKKATDVIDIPAINNMARERVGYPTQKPLALLRLLIKACARPGGVVLDPCCGSGTTLVAAHQLGRRGVGIDRNPDAVSVAQRRLLECERSTDQNPPERIS